MYCAGHIGSRRKHVANHTAPGLFQRMVVVTVWRSKLAKWLQDGHSTRFRLRLLESQLASKIITQRIQT